MLTLLPSVRIFAAVESVDDNGTEGKVARRSRLSALLNYYYRESD